MPAQKIKYKCGFCSNRTISIVLVLSIGAYLLRLEWLAGSVHTSIPTSKHEKYPNGIPEKFDRDGNVQTFPGNTIISHLSPSSDIYGSLEDLYKKLKEHPLSHLYTLLPPSSWHMTVYEGALDKRRAPAYWPADVDVNASIADCTAFLGEKLETFDLQYKMPIRMVLRAFKPLVNGISIHLEPQTPDENVEIRHLRDRLAVTTEMKQKGHDNYRFHISVAYLLRYLTDEQERELMWFLKEHFEEMPKNVELGLPEFCRFEDMFAYERLFYLQNAES